jgi:uncharacterized protein
MYLTSMDSRSPVRTASVDSAIAIALGLLCVAATGCRTQAKPTAPRQVIGVASAYPRLADVYSKLMPDISFEKVAGYGSLSYVQAVQNGSADVATSRADGAYMAFVGQLKEHPGVFDRLRGIAVLEAQPIRVLVRPNATISSIAGFRGLRVALGAPRSETALVAELILYAYGMSQADVQAKFMPPEEAVQQLLRGDLDGMFFLAPFPTSSIDILATRGGAQFLYVDGSAAEKLRSEYPFFTNVLIAQGTYPENDKPTHTLGVDGLLLCRADLDENLVHGLTKAYFEALPDQISNQDFPRQFAPDRAPATPIPLHPGAARYYRERELSR